MSPTGDLQRTYATNPREVCMACGRPAPTTEGMGPDELRERAADFFREAIRLEARAKHLEEGGKG